MSRIVNETGAAQLKQNMCFKRYFTEKTRYKVKEARCFLQMQTLVKKLEIEAKDKTSKLELKKEKSFQQMNVDKWELDPEVAKNKSINFKDKKTAWEVMFPKESIEVKKTNDEYQMIRNHTFDSLFNPVL